MASDFKGFNKIARLSRECVITEKIDGTNASIYIGEDGEVLVGARSGWITPDNDNFGFAAWARANEDGLRQLGVGHHFGEWWGSGIQRRYGLSERRFSLFNVSRWTLATIPWCCHVVPTLFSGTFSDAAVTNALDELKWSGSRAAQGFMKPEGVVVYHVAARQYFKKTLEKDEERKGEMREGCGDGILQVRR